MTQLLVKDAPFNFTEECIQAFDTFKHELTQAPIMIKPDWSLSFEIMYDAGDYVVGAVLRQRIDKHFKPIHYASKTMNEAQENYTTTKKELMAVILLLQEFDIKIRDKKGAKNLAVDHLSRLENPNLGKLTKAKTKDLFPKERLMAISYENNKPCQDGMDHFSVSKDMKNGAIKMYDEEGSEFIVNKQRVKPYQKNVLDINRDDDITLEDQGEVT
ncbi:reverse transcriptase domain-containing protein [Tanacetum coccineum]